MENLAASRDKGPILGVPTKPCDKIDNDHSLFGPILQPLICGNSHPGVDSCKIKLTAAQAERWAQAMLNREWNAAAAQHPFYI